MTKIDFTTFVLSVSSAAFVGLTEPECNIELARHNIDLLEMIKDKTAGNLTADEQRLVEQLLYETRMRFLDVQKAKPNG